MRVVSFWHGHEIVCCAFVCLLFFFCREHAPSLYQSKGFLVGLWRMASRSMIRAPRRGNARVVYREQPIRERRAAVSRIFFFLSYFLYSISVLFSPSILLCFLRPKKTNEKELGKYLGQSNSCVRQIPFLSFHFLRCCPLTRVAWPLSSSYSRYAALLDDRLPRPIPSL